MGLIACMVDDTVDPFIEYEVVVAEANTPEWLAARQSGIGASESAAILGESAWGTPLTIYNAKIADEVIDVQTDLMEMGHYAEAPIVAFLENHPERFGHIGRILPSPGLIRSLNWSWMLATPDRLVETPDGEVVPLELKSIEQIPAREWRVDFDEAEADPDNPFGTEVGRAARYVVPKKYQVQVQQQMAVYGAPYGYVAAWLGKATVVVLRVERDNEFIDEHLIGTVGDFWRFNVQTRTPPAPNVRDNLWDVWPGERGTAVEATADVLEDVFLMRRAAVDEREAKADREARKFAIATYMENHTHLLDPTTKRAVHTLLPQAGRTTIDAKKLQEQYPDVYQDVVKHGSPTRVHRATKEQIDIG